MLLRCRDRALSLDEVALVGVLNVTPDSFSDGGLWFDPDAAVAHALDMVAEGAAIVDVGGESTRPGAEPVSDEDELKRVLPVIEALVGEPGVMLSVDTRKASVARRAVEAGAAIINDTAGEAVDRAMDEVAADTGAAIVVMHSRGSPQTMRSLTEYADVVADVRAWLESRTAELERLGVAHDAISVDPGFGFAKAPDQNLTLLRRLDELVALGYPLLAGTSRKSFIGEVLGVPVKERMEGTLATLVWAVAQGARLVRVHEVEPAARAVRMTEAIRSSH